MSLHTLSCPRLPSSCSLRNMCHYVAICAPAICWTVNILNRRETTEAIRCDLLGFPFQLQFGKLLFVLFWLFMCVPKMAKFPWPFLLLYAGHKEYFFFNQMNKHSCPTSAGIFKLLPFYFIAYPWRSFTRRLQQSQKRFLLTDRSLQGCERKHLSIITCL